MAGYTLGIYWFRRDLRLNDHEGLYAASQTCRHVIPLYIASTWQQNHAWTGGNRQQFLCDSLTLLHDELESIGSKLIVRNGDAIIELEKIIRQTNADALFFQAACDPYGKRVDEEVYQLCERLQVKVISHYGAGLHAPETILNGEGKSYRVYTPYSKAWFLANKALPVPKVTRLSTPPDIFSEKIPSLAHWSLAASPAEIIAAGEKAAEKRLSETVSKIAADYSNKRDIPSASHTSRLSQDLRFGLLSMRTIFHTLKNAQKSASSQAALGFEKLLKELAWRDFYLAILHFFPEVLDTEFNPQWRGLAWDEPGEKYEKWCLGLTGFPLVDAGMRELLATGHMHNRIRMINAMFLTKDLHHDWKLGESWFMQHLVDGEIASNNGGWQWSAGTGADAAPYFRIQNPWLQSARHDPDGVYIKRWIPELRQTPAKLLHTPPEGMFPLADDYSMPIVDHHQERNRTLEIFAKHKSASY